MTIEEAHEELYYNQLRVSDILYKTAAVYKKESKSQKLFLSYEEGDQVSVYQPRDAQLKTKLSPSWVGPTTVL